MRRCDGIALESVAASWLRGRVQRGDHATAGTVPEARPEFGRGLGCHPDQMVSASRAVRSSD